MRSHFGNVLGTMMMLSLGTVGLATSTVGCNSATDVNEDVGVAHGQAQRIGLCGMAGPTCSIDAYSMPDVPAADKVNWDLANPYSLGGPSPYVLGAQQVVLDRSYKDSAGYVHDNAFSDRWFGSIGTAAGADQGCVVYQGCKFESAFKRSAAKIVADDFLTKIAPKTSFDITLMVTKAKADSIMAGTRALVTDDRRTACFPRRDPAALPYWGGLDRNNVLPPQKAGTVKADGAYGSEDVYAFPLTCVSSETDIVVVGTALAILGSAGWAFIAWGPAVLPWVGGVGLLSSQVAVNPAAAAELSSAITDVEVVGGDFAFQTAEVSTQAPLTLRYLLEQSFLQSPTLDIVWRARTQALVELAKLVQSAPGAYGYVQQAIINELAQYDAVYGVAGEIQGTMPFLYRQALLALQSVVAGH